jgi:ketosteroid isomerase-like protein
MSEHPNVTIVNKMTAAVMSEDTAALAEIFTGDMELHVRGSEAVAGDHRGVDGFLGALGSLLAGGEVELDQHFCIGTDGWAAEWEHATLTRGDAKLEFDDAFIYRFDDGRIAEIWMLIGATPASVAAWLA